MPRMDPTEEFTVGDADDGAPDGLLGAAGADASAGHTQHAASGPSPWIAGALALIVVGALAVPTVLPRTSATAFAKPVPSLQISVTSADPLAIVRFPPLLNALDAVDWSGMVSCTDPGSGVINCVNHGDGTDIVINTHNGKWLRTTPSVPRPGA